MPLENLKMINERLNIADKELENYNFSLNIISTSSWDDIHSDNFSKILYYESENSSEVEKISFNVVFKKGTNEVKEVFALFFSTGNLV